MVCEVGSATAALTVPTVAVVVPRISTPSPVGAVPVLVMVWLAASLVEVKVSVSAVEEIDAVTATPFEASTLFS